MRGPEDHPHDVRDDEPDEADGPGEGDGRAGEQRGHRDDRRAGGDDVEPEVLRLPLTEGEHVEAAVGTDHEDDRRAGEGHLEQVDAAERAHMPEDDGLQLVVLGDEGEEARRRLEAGTDGDADEEQPGGARGRTTTDPDDPGVGERVTEETLQRGPGDGQGSAREGAEEHPRRAQVLHDRRREVVAPLADAEGPLAEDRQRRARMDLDRPEADRHEHRRDEHDDTDERPPGSGALDDVRGSLGEVGESLGQSDGTGTGRRAGDLDLLTRHDDDVALLARRGVLERREGLVEAALATPLLEVGGTDEDDVGLGLQQALVAPPAPLEVTWMTLRSPRPSSSAILPASSSWSSTPVAMSSAASSMPR